MAVRKKTADFSRLPSVGLVGFDQIDLVMHSEADLFEKRLSACVFDVEIKNRLFVAGFDAVDDIAAHLIADAHFAVIGKNGDRLDADIVVGVAADDGVCQHFSVLDISVELHIKIFTDLSL